MPVFDIGAQDGPEIVSNRILTIPNGLSFARLVALPFVYRSLVDGKHGLALLLIAIFSSTDWFDGYIARRFNQVSKLGKVLDPLSDRFLIATVTVGMVVAGVLPAWSVAALLTRDVLILIGAVAFLKRGWDNPPVTRIGKAATFGLMFTLPTFLLASYFAPEGQQYLQWLRALAWVMYAAALPLYWLAGAQYAAYARDKLADADAS